MRVSLHWRETEREREMPHSTNKVGRAVPRQGSAEDLASTEGRKRDGERERERRKRKNERFWLKLRLESFHACSPKPLCNLRPIQKSPYIISVCSRHLKAPRFPAFSVGRFCGGFSGVRLLDSKRFGIRIQALGPVRLDARHVSAD